MSQPSGFHGWGAAGCPSKVSMKFCGPATGGAVSDTAGGDSDTPGSVIDAGDSELVSGPTGTPTSSAASGGGGVALVLARPAERDDDHRDERHDERQQRRHAQCPMTPLRTHLSNRTATDVRRGCASRRRLRLVPWMRLPIRVMRSATGPDPSWSGSRKVFHAWWSTFCAPQQFRGVSRHISQFPGCSVTSRAIMIRTGGYRTGGSGLWRCIQHDIEVLSASDRSTTSQFERFDLDHVDGWSSGDGPRSDEPGIGVGTRRSRLDGSGCSMTEHRSSSASRASPSSAPATSGSRPGHAWPRSAST